MARECGSSNDLNNDKQQKDFNENFVEVSVLEECTHPIRDKRKGATTLLTDIEIKKTKIVVEWEASPK